MYPFWLVDEASASGVGEVQPEAAAAQPGGADSGTPFFAQIEQVLGEETQPDAAFFMDTWTVGVSAASENFRRRQEGQKSREQGSPAWDTFSFFMPLFVATAEPPVQASWPLREAFAAERSIADPRRLRDEQMEDWQAPDEVEMVTPLTLESACHVLGVATTSTREQVKAAYRKMASRYHPDRQAQGGTREQKLASDRMASINEAYRLLCAGSSAR